jgi:hypothetical protein
VIVSAGARADDARPLVSVRIDATAGLPFTSEQLGEAILLRVDRTHLSTPVVVSIERLDTARHFRIAVGARRCEVALDPDPGPYAVRTVALLALDLVESESAPPLTAQLAATAGPASSWAGSVEALGAPGGTWGDGKLEGHVAVIRRLSPRWRATAAAGYGRLTRTVMGQSLSVDSAPVKAGLSLNLGRCDLAAAAALRWYRTRGASGVIPGAWLEARPALWRGAAGKVTLLVAVELAAERLQVRPLHSAPVFTSGYVTPWLGVTLTSP